MPASTRGWSGPTLLPSTASTEPATLAAIASGLKPTATCAAASVRPAWSRPSALGSRDTWNSENQCPAAFSLQHGAPQSEHYLKARSAETCGAEQG